MLQRTTAQAKIAQLRNRVRIVQGGASASKTFSIIPLLITYALQHKGKEISVVSESIPHLRRGAVRDFIKIMEWTGNMNQNEWNKSNLTYTFPNGSFIEFFSADHADKLRGARRDVLFINECNNVSFESYQQLAMRTREFIYLDFNPVAEFWVHSEIKDEKTSDFIILTYKDNEALEPALVAEIEKARDKAETSNYWRNYWQVYGLGLVGSLEGVVFNNWKIIDRLPDEARLLGCGLDFGYTNDPTACVEVYKYNDQRIIHQSIYQTGLLNSQIAKLLTHNVTIYADSAEPKSIDEIARYGLRILGATKGADSVKYGIDIMQQQDYLVTAQSVDLIKELRNYQWDVDRNGVKLNKPIDNYCHAIDALRYHEMMTLGIKSNYGSYNIR